MACPAWQPATASCVGQYLGRYPGQHYKRGHLCGRGGGGSRYAACCRTGGGARTGASGFRSEAAVQVVPIQQRVLCWAGCCVSLRGAWC